MKHLLLTTIAAVLLVGCGLSEADRALLKAANEGNIEAVKQHLADGADVHAKDKQGWTPLHYAAALNGHKEIAELLITKGADVNAKDKWGSTPLDSAIFARKAETVDLLRKHGGKTGKELKAAGKPTEPVAEAAKVEPVAEATQPEPPTAKARVISTYFTIHDAAAIGNIEAVKQHLAAETNVNTKDNKGDQTPLHYASVMGHEEIVELLIDNDADVNLKCSTGDTPLDWAMNFNHIETASILRKHGGKTKMELEVTEPVAEPPTAKAPDISIIDAARDGNIEAVKQHIAAGTDVNAQNGGRAPLIEAANGNNKEIVELLIANGADVNEKRSDGWTPLHGATTVGLKEVVELFIAESADVNAQMVDGSTPLNWAIERDNLDIVALLRKHGGKTLEELSIHGAAFEGNIKAVKQHLAAGADVNAKDDGGVTPLHLTAERGTKEIAELLIDAGAEVNVKEND
ncbi:ankyrin repeat domain-containing protein, partial [bacterium]|nr:ankyrin repeat domain-containing protein [bacterium]